MAHFPLKRPRHRKRSPIRTPCRVSPECSPKAVGIRRERRKRRNSPGDTLLENSTIPAQQRPCLEKQRKKGNTCQIPSPVDLASLGTLRQNQEMYPVNTRTATPIQYGLN